MEFQQYIKFATEQWKKSRSKSKYSAFNEDVPNKTNMWDNIAPTYDMALGSDLLRAEMTINRLEALGAFLDDTTAIDLGCGTGTYTLALAQKCKSVYALDNSEEMLKILKQKATKQGIKNIIPIHADWQTISPDDLPGKFDIVLSSLNTGINDYNSLIKMNEISRNLCVYASAHGTVKHSVRSVFEKIVFGREFHYTGKNDIIHALNIIYGMGYSPDLSYLPSNWMRCDKPNEALEAVCSKYGRYVSISEETRLKLQDYIWSHLDNNGLFVQQQTGQIGLMIWNVTTE